MASISVELVYNRFRAKCEDPIYSHQWLEVYEYLDDFFNTAISNYRVLDLFSQFTVTNRDVGTGMLGYLPVLNENNEQEVDEGNLVYRCNSEINYIFKKQIDDSVDMQFLIDILARLMIVAWYEPKLNSVKVVNQMYGGKEEKFYSQKQHADSLSEKKEKEERNVYKKIRDRSRKNNSYLSGGE